MMTIRNEYNLAYGSSPTISARKWSRMVLLLRKLRTPVLDNHQLSVAS